MLSREERTNHFSGVCCPDSNCLLIFPFLCFFPSFPQATWLRFPVLLAVVAMPEPNAEVLGHLPEQQGYPVGGHHSVVPLNPLTPVLGLVAGALIKGIELWLPGAPTFRSVTLDLCHVDLCHHSWWGQPMLGSCQPSFWCPPGAGKSCGWLHGGSFMERD